MDSNILIEFCNGVIPYLNDYDDYNFIISLLIRDIRTNNIIYTNINNSWYEYNILLKKWIPFDFNNILNKIDNFYEFFSVQLIDYINNNELLNRNNKIKFISISNKIAKFIRSREYDISRIYTFCKNLFSINNII
tara:strand:+ start:105 stop:509 length:405 start_codon:yes stop_codon:yes gene_type:complete